MTAHVDDHLLQEQHGAVTLLTLNRPDSLNSLSHRLLTDLRQRLVALDTDPSVRAIVLTGSGRAFSAGADLGAPSSDAEDTVRRLYNPLIVSLMELSTPVVAAVNGIAAGAAFSLALACDLRIAAESAAFQLSFTRIGLVPDAGATWLLPRTVGMTRASEIALLARKITSSEALQWSLVNEVVDNPNVVDRALEVAEQLAQLAASVGATKTLLRDSHHRELADQLDAEATAQGLAQHSPDFIEVRAAFREKRAPSFT